MAHSCASVDNTAGSPPLLGSAGSISQPWVRGRQFRRAGESQRPLRRRLPPWPARGGARGQPGLARGGGRVSFSSSSARPCVGQALGGQGAPEKTAISWRGALTGPSCGGLDGVPLLGPLLESAADRLRPSSVPQFLAGGRGCRVVLQGLAGGRLSEAPVQELAVPPAGSGRRAHTGFADAARSPIHSARSGSFRTVRC